MKIVKVIMKLRRIILFYFVCLVGVVSAFAANGHEIRFIYCSDLHYGINDSLEERRLMPIRLLARW